LGNVRTEASVGTSDDGVTQKVEVKAGISMVGMAEVPNPVTLAPYRTFHDVTQPESPFVLRVKMEGERAFAALFEADGGRWQQTAVQEIAAWLEKELKGKIPVLA